MDQELFRSLKYWDKALLKETDPLRELSEKLCDIPIKPLTVTELIGLRYQIAEILAVVQLNHENNVAIIEEVNERKSFWHRLLNR